jgi:hypothetical protein
MGRKKIAIERINDTRLRIVSKKEIGAFFLSIISKNKLPLAIIFKYKFTLARFITEILILNP